MFGLAETCICAFSRSKHFISLFFLSLGHLDFGFLLVSLLSACWLSLCLCLDVVFTISGFVWWRVLVECRVRCILYDQRALPA